MKIAAYLLLVLFVVGTLSLGFITILAPDLEAKKPPDCWTQCWVKDGVKCCTRCCQGPHGVECYPPCF